MFNVFQTSKRESKQNSVHFSLLYEKRDLNCVFSSLQILYQKIKTTKLKATSITFKISKSADPV